jgi:hypothetical protein
MTYEQSAGSAFASEPMMMVATQRLAVIWITRFAAIGQSHDVVNLLRWRVATVN